jgi:hypothetical protein
MHLAATSALTEGREHIEMLLLVLLLLLLLLRLS